MHIYYRGNLIEAINMKRGNTKTITTSDKEFALIKKAAEIQEKSIAAFMRDASIMLALKVMK